jgi:hypothetical protein
MVLIGSKRKSWKPSPLESIKIDVDRTSIFGNPFPAREERYRQAACDLFEEYFHAELLHSDKIKVELGKMADLVRSGKRISLQCWCVPRRCHAQTIRNYLLKELHRLDLEDL